MPSYWCCRASKNKFAALSSPYLLFFLLHLTNQREYCIRCSYFIHFIEKQIQSASLRIYSFSSFFPSSPRSYLHSDRHLNTFPCPSESETTFYSFCSLNIFNCDRFDVCDCTRCAPSSIFKCIIFRRERKSSSAEKCGVKISNSEIEKENYLAKQNISANDGDCGGGAEWKHRNI